MAETIRTLVNVTDIFGEYGSTREAYEALGRTAFLKEIHDTVKENQESYLGSEIDYIMDFWQEEDGWVSGVTKPERIIEEAERWNALLVTRLCEELEKFDALKDRWGLNTMAELFKALENGRTERGFDYGLSLYRLRRGFNDLDSRFLYGCNHMVLDTEPGWYGFDYSIKIPDVALKKIKEHPEWYAIIETYYK